MSSKAYEKFKKTVVRCEELVRAYKILHKNHKKKSNIPAPKDIVRGAVVLSVSALDAYVTDVFSEKLVIYLKQRQPEEPLIELLSQAGLDTKEALSLIVMERPYRRIRTLIERHYDSYTTQRFDVIDKLFLPYRLKGITSNAEKKSGRKTLKASVGKLIERRHNIAHGGDYNSHGRIKNIDEEQIEKRIKDLHILVKNMDEIICSRIK
tara:strand:+ start:1936 stop:2559 length:624 start_codon:yes stop_codon:yes gene_type:complete